MTIRTAVDILVLIVLLLNLLLSYGLARKLRHLSSSDGGRSADAYGIVAPAAGVRVDPSLDRHPWPETHYGMLTGDHLVAMVVPGCGGCSALKRELEAVRRLPAPVWVLADPAVGDAHAIQYASTWTFAEQRLAAPDQFHLMRSLEEPRATPVIMFLRDGVVMASGYRYRDIAPAIRRLGAN